MADAPAPPDFPRGVGQVQVFFCAYAECCVIFARLPQGYAMVQVARLVLGFEEWVDFPEAVGAYESGRVPAVGY